MRETPCGFILLNSYMELSVVLQVETPIQLVPWFSKIIWSINKLHDVGIVDRATMFRVMVYGSSTWFQFDSWCSGLIFKDQVDMFFSCDGLGGKG